MPKIDLARVKLDASTGYPEPYRSAVAGRVRQRLGDAAGLDKFGVNLTRLKPGAQSRSGFGMPPRTSSCSSSRANSCCARYRKDEGGGHYLHKSGERYRR
jgi:hypothetical protein